MSRSRRLPTQQDVQEQGKCGHGFNYGGPGGTPRYCGKPSEPGATFGDCPHHAREFLEKSREISRNDPAYQSADRIERGDRVMDAEHWENLGARRKDDVERLVREGAIRQRVAVARRRAGLERTRGRSR